MSYSVITVHLDNPPNGAVCGIDEGLNERFTTNRSIVNCPCCLGDHVWIGQKTNSPTEADDYIEYCAVCGTENQGSFVE